MSTGVSEPDGTETGTLDLGVVAAPAGRFVLAQSWWIASELCRRTGTLRIWEDRPVDGFYHGLTVASAQGRSSRLNEVFMNWVGCLHIHAGDVSTEQITWAETLAAQSPLDVVKRVEASLRWTVASAAPTTARSIVYRALASCLWQRINHRETWSVADGHTQSMVDSRAGRERGAFLAEYDGARAAVARACDGDLGRVWALQSGDDHRALLMDTGILFRRGAPPVDLMGIYRRSGQLEALTRLVLDH